MKRHHTLIVENYVAYQFCLSLSKNLLSFTPIRRVRRLRNEYALDREAHMPNLVTQQQTVVLAHMMCF